MVARDWLRGASVAGLVATLLLTQAVSYGETQTTPPVSIQPEAPPGIGAMIQRLINWLYWGAWVAVFGAGIYGGLNIAMGDSERGKKFLGGAIVGAMVLAALTVIIPALVGG